MKKIQIVKLVTVYNFIILVSLVKVLNHIILVDLSSLGNNISGYFTLIHHLPLDLKLNSERKKAHKDNLDHRHRTTSHLHSIINI